MREARNPRAPADGWNHRAVRADLRFGKQPSGEKRAQNAFVNEVLLQTQLAFGVPDGHPRAGAGAAGRTIQHARPRRNDHRVFRIGLRMRRRRG